MWDDKHPNVDSFTMITFIAVAYHAIVLIILKRIIHTLITGLYVFQCSDCGKWMRSRYTLNSTAKT